MIWFMPVVLLLEWSKVIKWHFDTPCDEVCFSSLRYQWDLLMLLKNKYWIMNWIFFVFRKFYCFNQKEKKNEILNPQTQKLLGERNALNQFSLHCAKFYVIYITVICMASILFQMRQNSLHLKLLPETKHCMLKMHMLPKNKCRYAYVIAPNA